VNFILAAGTLWWREVVRFLRQRNRIVGALGTPLVFWLIIGSGLGHSFRSGALGGEHYLEYSFPGTLALIVLFTAIFSTISIIEDRQTGFLQSVQVAPVHRSAITLGKTMGATTLALIQAFLFLLLAPTVGIALTLKSVAAVVMVLILVAFALAAVGFLIAWKMDSTQGFHAIMNLVLLPMWVLSGAFFPAAGLPGWIVWIMYLNPLTYGLAAIRRCLYLDSPAAAGAVPGLALSLAITALFAAFAFVVAALAAERKAA
jgi:ABC-2 type transport system permease protein